jgi:predicted dehydrogenase
MSRVTVAVLGGGQIACHVHLPLLASLPGVSVAALAEADPGRRAAAARLAPGATTYADYRDLLDAASVEAVILCLPPTLNLAAATAAFAAGKHVYLEKPLAASLADAAAILAAWRGSGCVGMIGFNYRFHPLLQALRRDLQAGRVGRPIAAQTVFTTAGQPRSGWRAARGSGGGALLDLASHHIDLVRWLFQAEVALVSARLSSLHSEHDSAVLDLRLEGGLDVQTLAAYGAIEEDRLAVYGPQGKLLLDRYRGLDVEFTAPRARRSRLRALGRALAAPARLPYWLAKRRSPANDPSYRAALVRFVASVRTGAPASPDLLDGYRSLAVVEAAESSARTGQAATPPE